MLPLEVLAVIPLNDGIFKFTDSVGVAKYFEYAISDFSLLAIVAVGQHVIGSRLSQRWRKPLDGINIYHTLHIEQVDGYLDCIILAYLVYRLYIGSIYQLRYLERIELEWVLELLQLLLLFLLIFVHPQNPTGALRLDVHFVISTKFWHAVHLSLVHA